MIVTMICFTMCMPEIQEVGEMPGIWFWFLPHSENFQRMAIPYPDATDVHFSARIGDPRAFFNCIFRVICVDLESAKQRLTWIYRARLFFLLLRLCRPFSDCFFWTGVRSHDHLCAGTGTWDFAQLSVLHGSSSRSLRILQAWSSFYSFFLDLPIFMQVLRLLWRRWFFLLRQLLLAKAAFWNPTISVIHPSFLIWHAGFASPVTPVVTTTFFVFYNLR